jgi:carbon storage regulator CsrA
MLLLSRRVDQGIEFPQLGITVRILQIRGKIAKVAITAPSWIQVLRDEIASQRSAGEPHAKRTRNGGGVDGNAPDSNAGDRNAIDNAQEHRRRNQLNLLQLQVDAIQSRIERGDLEAAEAMLQSLMKGQIECSADRLDLATKASPTTVHSPIHLLVVEDSDNERGLMVHMLASRGFVVRVARDGNEAFQPLITGGSVPDCILMDIQMPIADGAETLQRLRRDQRFASIPIFAVTGTRRREEQEPASGGWDGWFQKPVDVASLVARIQDECMTRQAVSSSISV